MRSATELMPARCLSTFYDSQSGMHVKIPGQEMRIHLLTPSTPDVRQLQELLAARPSSVHFESAVGRMDPALVSTLSKSSGPTAISILPPDEQEEPVEQLSTSTGKEMEVEVVLRLDLADEEGYRVEPWQERAEFWTGTLGYKLRVELLNAFCGRCVSLCVRPWVSVCL